MEEGLKVVRDTKPEKENAPKLCKIKENDNAMAILITYTVTSMHSRRVSLINE